MLYCQYQFIRTHYAYEYAFNMKVQIYVSDLALSLIVFYDVLECVCDSDLYQDPLHPILQINRLRGS